MYTVLSQRVLWWSVEHCEHARSYEWIHIADVKCKCKNDLCLRSSSPSYEQPNRRVLQLQCSQFSKCNGLNNCPVFGLFCADFTIIMKRSVCLYAFLGLCVFVNIVLAGQLCSKYNGYHHHHVMGVCLSLLIWKCFAVICPRQSTRWHSNRNIPSHATIYYVNLNSYNYVILSCEIMQAYGFILSTLFQGSPLLFAFCSFDSLPCNRRTIILKISSLW